MVRPGHTGGSVLANMSSMGTLQPFRFKKKAFSGVQAVQRDEMNAHVSSDDDSISDGVGIDASGAPVGIIPDEQKVLLRGVTPLAPYLSARGP